MSVWEMDFPKLEDEGYSPTSPVTPDYNCIAWAACDDQRWWWPDAFMQYYWPPTAPRKESIDAFIYAFSTLGYEVCDNSSYEPGKDKIALYALGEKPTHAARQIPSGLWTSKLGGNIDIEHTLEGLAGPTYGSATLFMSR